MDTLINTLDQDRRSSPRHSVRTALRIRAWKTAVPEHRAESINVSLRGIYFATKTVLCEGEIVEVLLKMPEEVTGGPATEWRCTGNVVRVEPADSLRGNVGVGVQFYFYDASRPEHPEQPVCAGSLWRMLPPTARNQAA